VTHLEPQRTANPRLSKIVVAGLVTIAAIAAGAQLLQSSTVPAPTVGTSTSSSTTAALSAIPHDSLPPRADDRRRIDEPGLPGGEGRGDLPAADGGVLGEADGTLPEGTTIFDDNVTGVARLDPALRDALRRAAGAAQANGLRFLVNSGWRSENYQEHLLADAVTKYGSRQEALRWVAEPTTSAHETGDAVDLGPATTTSWLSQHGAAYGLCQIYRNEPWHYELRPDAADHGCPEMYADAAHDPRTQR
jgi:hypothetical protein